ncbi:MAG: GAF domain-containing protein [Anaerolineae bacterium]|nr:GAF domain-containing protein [Anaerolineae bacterium]
MRGKDTLVRSAERKLDRTQLRTLIRASKLLNGSLDHDRVLHKLMVLAGRGVDADRVTLYLVDKPSGQLRSMVLLGRELHEIRLASGEGLAGFVARSGETVMVDNAYRDPRFSRHADKVSGYRTRTVLAVPMCDPRDEVIGVVQALNKRRGFFTARDAVYLLALAGHASLALENARLHASLAGDYERLSFLYLISNLLITEMYLPDVLRMVMEGVTKTLGVESSAILLWDEPRQRLVFHTIAGPNQGKVAQLDVPPEGSIAGWVFQNREAVVIDDVQHDPRHFREVDARTGMVTRTLIGVPLKAHHKVIGVLEAMNRLDGQPFDEADLELARAVAAHAALAIEHARHLDPNT